MKSLALIITALIFIGCGGGSGGSNSGTEENTSITGGVNTIGGQALPVGVPSELDKIAKRNKTD